MTSFDLLIEAHTPGRSRKTTKVERYPKDIFFTRGFLEHLEKEYFDIHSGNRNYYSNFLKAISFEVDKFKNSPAAMDRYIDGGSGDMIMHDEEEMSDDIISAEIELEEIK